MPESDCNQPNPMSPCSEDPALRIDHAHPSPAPAQHRVPTHPATAAVPSDLNKTEPEPFAWRDLNRSPHTPSVHIQLGACRVSLEQQQQLCPGRVLQLDNPVDEPVEIVVDGEVFGYGRVVAVDGKLAIQISEIRQSVQRRLT